MSTTVGSSTATSGAKRIKNNFLPIHDRTAYKSNKLLKNAMGNSKMQALDPYQEHMNEPFLNSSLSREARTRSFTKL